MGRRIDADELIKRITTEADEIITDNAHAVGMYNGLELAKAMALNAPTIDAETVKHGRWKGHEDDDDLQCPFCGAEFDNIANDILDDWNYCPNCGAKKALEGEKYAED